jgi:hypothetical protein
MPRVARNFNTVDAGKVGTVSVDEVHTFMKARHNAANNQDQTIRTTKRAPTGARSVWWFSRQTQAGPFVATEIS